jgi:DmsE family decaheme c-type cytochrome
MKVFPTGKHLGAAASLLLLGLSLARAQSNQAPAAAPQGTAAPQAQSGYVGDDTCVTCHEAEGKSFKATMHGQAENPRTPAAAQGCETCHGPGQAHVDDPAKIDSIKRFKSMPARDVSATCRSCHNRSEHAMWDGSAHNARNLGCTTCHSVHNPKSPHSQLVQASVIEVCATCHRTQVNKQMRTSHMPVREGKMTCTTCHNPHGSTNVKQLRVGNYVNESCFACHAEKRGPFLWDHAAGREACSTCHDPHGSNNDRLLVSRTPMLCQRCHIGTRHPSTIYDGTALNSRSNRLILRGCVNCHQQIHGSNHPSGNTFLR